MDNTAEFGAVELSRRSLLRKVAATAGSAAMLSMSGICPATAQTKVSQKLAQYQDTPKGTQRCDNCVEFEPPASCKIVVGTIAQSGWCEFWGKKPA